MNPRIQYLMNHPFDVQLSDVALLQDEIDKYPYFSTLRILLLFGLKEFDHTTYQEELKKTSIYSPSRAALYHYLHKEKKASETEFTTTPEISSDENISEETKMHPTEKFDENFVETLENEIEETENKPIEKKEPLPSQMTFSEWLALSNSDSEPEKTPSEREIKYRLIDEFIEKSPKISPIEKPRFDSQPVKTEPTPEYSDLMTETLAQIYTEQKKHEKAIRAYRILALKYPEKSDLFHDKIRQLEEMKNS
ncbi:MAG: hypothetical protein WDA08_08300 [Weeksellaceae bacterium]